MNLNQSTSVSTNRRVVSTPEVSTYKGYIVVDRVTSADLVDPSTFQWMSCPSARSARWTAAVLSRVNGELAASSNYNSVLQQKNDLQLAFRIGGALEELNPSTIKVQ